MPFNRLQVRVNDELVLDAGSYETIASGGGAECLIRPPEVTLFRQVLEYLRGKEDPKGRLPGSATEREGVAATAVALRWGSYLCVLLDRGKPLWAAADSPGRSRISDGEMARINIEASAALAEWIDLRRSETGGGIYGQLVDRAVRYLPMPQRTAKRRMAPFAAFANAKLAAQVMTAIDPAHLALARADADRHATRLFANALVNSAWRNGPVEDVHAGTGRTYPFDVRRVSPGEERQLMRSAAEGLALGLSVCDWFEAEEDRRPWAEQVLPYAFAPFIAPSQWTLTETSRAIRLVVGDGP